MLDTCFRYSFHKSLILYKASALIVSIAKKRIFHTKQMKILTHHIYEYNKGLRSLVLYTMSTAEKARVKELLDNRRISYCFSKVTSDRINLFFGDEVCIKIIKSFGGKPLSDYTDEEDFMLGTMLGYDRILQCERYIKRKKL